MKFKKSNDYSKVPTYSAKGNSEYEYVVYRDGSNFHINVFHAGRAVEVISQFKTAAAAKKYANLQNSYLDGI